MPKTVIIVGSEMEKREKTNELLIVNRENLIQNEEKEKLAAMLLLADKKLVFKKDEKEKLADELIIANQQLAFQNWEKEKRADELIIANKELAFQNIEKEKRADELILADKELVFQNEEKDKRAAELVIANKELIFQNREKEKRADELIIANKELAFQNQEKEKRANELIIANKELAFQNTEKEKRADELIIANKELALQNEEKKKRGVELTRSKQLLDETGKLARIGGWEIDLKKNDLIWSDMVYEIHEVEPDYQPTVESGINFYAPEAIPVISEAVRRAIEEGKSFDKDLQLITAKQNRIWVRAIGQAYRVNGEIVKIGGVFQDITSRKQAEQELILANKELAFQNKEKEKRANELIIANKELAFQNEEKEKRANELIIANKELAFQNKEKEKRASELIIANKELANQNEEKEKRANELIIANKAFLQSEENFRRSISESPLGIRIISIEGETIYVNKAFLDIYEFNSLEEYRSIPAIKRYTPESYAQHQIRKEKIKNGSDIFDYELSIVRGNAEIRYLKVWRKAVLWNGVKHYQTFNLDITERKLASDALNNSQQELRKFATHLQNVREEEKLSLSREIHDDLCQISVALKIDLGMFKNKISKGIEVTTSEELLSKLNDFSSQVDNTIKSARRIMNGLRPELIELLGFEEACKSYLRDFKETHHISCQFESAIMILNINLEQSVALFRILQEALNNIIKHAKATLVTVYLSNPAGKLVLQVVDNGVGFDVNHNGRQDSYGLIGMKERVFLLDGNLVITSKVGKGTSVRVEIPYLFK